MPVEVGFPRFEELPKELQLKVWNYAASPHGFLQISETLMARINCHIRCAGPIRIIFGHFTAPKALCLYIPQHNLATVTEIGRARRAVMSACSASWQVALGAWRSEISAIEIADGPAICDRLVYDATSAEARGARQILLKFLEKRIS